MVSQQNIREHVKAAELLLNSKQWGNAEVPLLALLDANFKPELILNQLVLVYSYLNNLEALEVTLCDLVARFKVTQKYTDQLVNFYAGQQRWRESVKCYQDLLEQSPNDPNLYFNVAYYQKLDGDFDAALVSYQQSLDLGVQGAEEVLTNMAVINSENLRREDESKRLLERAVKLNPTYTTALFNLAFIYEEEGDVAMAAAYLDKVLALEPEHFRALARLADISPNRIDVNRALIDSLNASLESKDIELADRTHLLFALGKKLDQSQKYNAAFDAYSKANSVAQSLSIEYSAHSVERNTDRNIEVFNCEWFEKNASESQAEPIFICGMFRSGSTLVEQILAAHPSITAGGERDFFPQLISKNFKQYPHSVEGVGLEQLNELAVRYCSDLNKAFPQASLITDKRPDNFMYLGLIKSVFPKAKIINTMRSPLDNCISVYFLQLAMSYANRLEDIAHYYHQQRRMMGHWQSLFQSSMHSVSYEKLVSGPEETISDLLSFLGLEWSDHCLSFHQLSNRVKTASVAQVREPLYRTSVDRWKNYQHPLRQLSEQFDSVKKLGDL